MHSQPFCNEDIVMSDTFANQGNKQPAQKTDEGSGRQNAGGSLAEQANAVARSISEQASGLAQHATRQVKDQAAELTESAKGLASDAGGKLRDAVEAQKSAGADYVSGLAGAVRRAAGEFDGEIPQAAEYIRGAAQAIDDFSGAIKRRDLSQLVRDVQEFARSQPTAFLGATVLAGFAAVRFLKSSTTSAPGGSPVSSRDLPTSERSPVDSTNKSAAALPSSDHSTRGY